MSDSEQIRPLLLPGGILASDRQIGYFTNIDNSIEAIDLNEGKTLWTNEIASYPLMAASNWLIAQKIIPDRSNVFEIVKLDPNRDGSLLWVSAPIVFPDWVCVRQQPHYKWDINLNFQVSATTDNLCLDWQAQTFYRGGAAPPVNLVTFSERGTVRIDLNSGEVEMLSSEDTQDAAVVEEIPPGYWIAGAKIVYVTTDNIQGERELQLRMRDRFGDRSVERIIELCKGKTINYLVTLDGYYILVRPEICAEAKQPWLMFAAETGQLESTLNYDIGDRGTSIRSISIFNSKIYYLVDRRIDLEKHQSVLRIQDLNSGELCWEYEIEPHQIAMPMMP
jgi:hypothetical protein